MDVGGYDYRPNVLFDPHHPTIPWTVPQNLDSGINARRARIGVIGTFMADWVYSLIYDMGGSSDGFGNSATGCVVSGAGSATCRIGLLPGGITSGIQTAYLSYQGFKGPSWNVAIEGGYSNTFFTLDQATGTNDIMFLERASAQVIASFAAGSSARISEAGRTAIGTGRVPT